MVHDRQGEGLTLFRRVALAGHQVGQLVQADVAQGDGGIAAVEQLVDGLPLVQPGQCAVLPVDGADVGTDTLQSVVAAHEGFVANFQPTVELRPELVHVPADFQADLGQVDGDDTLVEAAFKLVVAVLVLPGSQEAPAAHGGEHVALVIFPHLLGGDVVRIHPLGGALGCQLGQVVEPAAGQVVVLVDDVDQLGEGGGDVDAALVLDAHQTLAQAFLHDHGVLLHIGVVVPDVEEEGDEGGLAVGGHEGVDLVLDGLDAVGQLGAQTLVHQLVQQFLVHLPAGGLQNLALEFLLAPPQVLAQVADVHALAAVLVGGHAGDDLGGDGAGHLEALGAFDELAVHHGAVVQHIADVDEAAVEDGLNEIVRVVEVEQTLVMGLGDLLRQQDAAGQVPADDAGDVVPLGGSHGGILVGVLLRHLLVGVVEQAEDGLVGGVLLPSQRAEVAVEDVGFGELVLAALHQLPFHHILDVLHQQPGPVQRAYCIGDGIDALLVDAVFWVHSGVGLLDGDNDLRPVKIHRVAVSLDYFHWEKPPYHSKASGLTGMVGRTHRVLLVCISIAEARTKRKMLCSKTL